MKNIIKTLIIVLLIAIFTIYFSLKIRIKDVYVEGLTKYDEDKFISMILPDDNSRISILLFASDKLFSHKKINHINSYTISWKSPISIVIKVIENEPVGFIKKDLKCVYFDRDGVVSDIIASRMENVPEVIGVEANEFKKGTVLSVINKDMYNLALMITNFAKNKSLPLEYVDISKIDDIKLYVGNIIVEIGTVRYLDIKLQRLNDIYKEIKDLSGTLDLKEAKRNMVDEQYIFKKS